MTSKTIIISSPKENNTRGILSIFQEEDLLKCRLRVYNMDSLSKLCKIGIYHQNQVYTANLLNKNGVYESSFVGDFCMDKDFYAAIINTEKDNEVLLAGGTYQGFYFNDNSVFLTDEKFDNSQIKNEGNIKEENNEECSENCDRCVNCKYKEFFYSSQNYDINQQKTEKIEENLKKENENNEKFENVLNLIIPQLDSLFEQYEADEELNNLMQNGKFVKINENGEQYSIGAIYEKLELRYICYAIKREYNINPPEELGKHYQWLPIDNEDPLSEGYYVVFQDAKDLKIVEL